MSPAGVDYIGIDQNLIFFPGSATTECVDVTIIDDANFEGSEVFFFLIPAFQVDSAVSTVSNPTSATVFITDPEDGKWSECV